MMLVNLPSLILWVCLLLSLASLPVSATGDKQIDKAGSSSQPVSEATHIDSNSHLVSYEDILQGRFRHTDTVPASEHHPDTFLFADPPQRGWAPIFDLTHLQPYSSLKPLVHRYRHLHIYRTLPSARLQSHIIVLQTDLRKPPLLTDGNRIHDLNERINRIEYIKSRYGRKVAWARFHKLFTPIHGPEKAGPLWEEIVQ